MFYIVVSGHVFDLFSPNRYSYSSNKYNKYNGIRSNSATKVSRKVIYPPSCGENHIKLLSSREYRYCCVVVW